MSGDAALAARVEALLSEGAGDPVGLALVGTLIARAEELPPSGRGALLARAEALLEVYRTRAPEPESPAREVPDAWREALDARARARAPRGPREALPSAVIAEEIRATAATARAVDQVPEAAGPYNGAAVAARALEELAALAPGYVSSYVAWLEDLAALAELPDARTASSRRREARAQRANAVARR